MTAQEIVERGLAASTTEGCVVLVHETSSVNLRWAVNTLTTNGFMAGRDVTVVAVVGEGQQASAGVVTRTGATADTVADLVAAAQVAAVENGIEEDANPLVEGVPASPDWDDPPAVTSAGVFETIAPGLGEAFGRARGEQRELFGYAEHDLVTSYLGTSTGLRLRHAQPTARFELTGKSDSRSLSTWVGAGGRDFGGTDVVAMDDEVRTRLDWQSRRVEVPPGRHTTLLSPSALADLMVYLYWTADARDAAEGRTVFSRPGGRTRVGETLTPRALRLFSDPAYPGLECEPFVSTTTSSSAASVFDNGLPVAATEWLHDGRLANLYSSRHTAALTGLPVKPPQDNLILEDRAAAGSLQDLVATTDDGLLLTCLWYIREVDPQNLLLTGLTRDGVYVVRGGEVVGATTNFRFNESPVDMLGRIDEVGGTRPCLPREWADFFSRAAMPPVRIDGFNMSTVSEGT
ncbi:MAG: metallopeptidase TldD-related protein [Candidatus Nanopelagicales bacterium]